jgi:hypothetical protein
MDKEPQRPAFIKIAKGASVKGLHITDSTVIGDADFINNEGEVEDASLKRNRHIIPPRLKPLVAAIKKPSANGGKGWKIIVGFIFVSIMAPISVNIVTELWKERHATTTQEQPQLLQQQSSAGNIQK